VTGIATAGADRSVPCDAHRVRGEACGRIGVAVDGTTPPQSARSMPEPTDYEAIADRYAAEIDQRPWNALYERPAMLELLPSVTGKDVLDAGCGPGWYTDWLVRHDARVVAVDRSARMVELTSARLAGRARGIRGDLSDLKELQDGTFDLILSSLVLHYIDDLPKTFREWGRLLRSGGRIVFSTHHPTHDQKSLFNPGYLIEELIEEKWGWLAVQMRYYRRPLSSLTEPMAAAGFVIERIVEPRPSEELRSADAQGYEQLSRLPAFLLVRARKDIAYQMGDTAIAV
jgi:SAM-dependent methyltransferase